MFDRLNAYRIMWILVNYDLPVDSKLDRKRAASFRKKILADGFVMFQFSMYIRHCSSKEHSEVHVKRVKSILPPKGLVGILTITDRQFELMEIFRSQQPEKPPVGALQLELF